MNEVEWDFNRWTQLHNPVCGKSGTRIESPNEPKVKRYKMTKLALSAKDPDE
jgi:hypothetical protein